MSRTGKGPLRPSARPPCAARDPRLAEARAAFLAGAPDVAARLCEAVLARRPNEVEALIVLGSALERLGRGEEGRARLAKACRLAPRRADAHYALGVVAAALGDHQAAIAAYRRAIARDPDMKEAHNNLGLALMARGDGEAAIAAYRRALALDPDYGAALSNLAGALEALGELAEAEACYRRALRTKPDNPVVLSNLGRLLYESERYDEAETWLARAVAIAPDFAKAHANLGLVRDARGDLAGAVSAFGRALDCDSGHEGATVSLMRTLQHLADWQTAAGLAARADAMTEAALAEGRKPQESPFIAATRGAAPMRVRAIAEAWSREIAAKATHRALPPRPPARRERIVLGYLSSDFRDHPVGHLVAGMFAHHDRERFIVIAYDTARSAADAYAERIAAGCDDIVALAGLDDGAAARRIREDAVDILIELNGYTKGHRLGVPARRPAPLQATWLGYPATTGASFIDYAVVDRVAVPAEHTTHFSEALVRLPHTFLVTDDRQPIAERPMARADWGLPEAGVVYCCFNNTYKIDPETFHLWMEILAAVPDAVLWLAARSPAVAARLRDAAGAQGIAPERLLFADRVPGKDIHLARLALADLALDTLVCNGHTTTADALWAGVPVLTVAGPALAARIAASQLAAIGLDELIAADAEAYREKAIVLGRDGAARAALRARLGANRATMPLFGTARFVRDLERAFEEMWRRALANEPPAAIDVAP